ncbi:AIG2 family protein [Colletotrichum abscissum]|uniref:gamma-glutamylcyclotransferase n=1 Tax=Colletotrichum abscissum TaxID=1671311 RepID=A0A9P9XTE4_9PEZI|nr:AIG2 family protein [Colletotrichum abscissum]KAI3559431.1 AIG2 family protein [Colletotrichum abscissum]KAK1525431.1 AIG2 family protein [Colletotrichum abscissum]
MVSPDPPRLYFAYGSNLSPTQMSLRCPASTPLGLAHLPDHTFIINARRYANVVPNGPVNPAYLADADAAAAPTTDPASASAPPPPPSAPPSAAPGVYGVLYALPPRDEATLDRCEGVPHAYQKQDLAVSIANLASKGIGAASAAAGLAPGSNVTALVYVDTERTEPSTPRAEYVDRMNRGVDEATERFGLPRGYVDDVIRGYIPAAAASSEEDTKTIKDPFLEIS